MRRSCGRRWSRLSFLLAMSLVLPYLSDGKTTSGFLTALDAHAATSSNRMALVIGNANYPEQPLVNTLNDAHDMAAKLEELGFKVTKHTDLGRRALAMAITDFVRAVQGNDGVTLFYYSGHGLQVEGNNYLLPVDARIRDALDVPNEAVPLNTLLAGLNDRGDHTVNLLFLDACRDNPYRRSDRKGLGDKGLARVHAPKGTLIHYATRPGETASDNPSGRNGLFTQHLLRTLDQPGLEIKDAFQQVARDVHRESGNAQLPWQEGIIFGRFYFRPPAASETRAIAPATDPTSTPVQTSRPDALTYWTLIQDSRDADTYRAFLERFDDPVLASLARAKLRELEQSPSAPASATSGTTVEPPSQAELALARAGEIPPQIIQYALHELGHYRGQLDGLIGPGTRAAIRAFQQSKGFVATGELNNAQRVTLISDAAQAGHPNSQNALGMMAASGVGVVKDQVAARRWLQAAAAQGNAYAAYNLGLLYRDGLGGSRSLSEAQRYFKQAKAGGYEPAVAALNALSTER